MSDLEKFDTSSDLDESDVAARLLGLDRWIPSLAMTVKAEKSDREGVYEEFECRGEFQDFNLLL